MKFLALLTVSLAFGSVTAHAYGPLKFPFSDTLYSLTRGWSSSHTGIDIDTPNDPTAPINVVASTAGTVFEHADGANNDVGCVCYGNYVKVDHGSGLVTLYAHLKKYSLTSVSTSHGSVSAGTVLASENNSGDSTGDHLHFESRVNGTSVNPYQTPVSSSNYLWTSDPPSLPSSTPPPQPYAPTGLSPTGAKFKVSTTFGWTDNGMNNGQPANPFRLKIWKSLNGTITGSAIHDALASGNPTTVSVPSAGEYQFIIIAYNGLSGADERWADSAYATFKVVDQFDYDRDGKSDILWRNQSTGANTFWKMNGASYVGPDGIEAVTDTNWEVVATADYNRDGWVDILWQNRTIGSATWWAMNGTTHVGSDAVASSIPTEWKIVGAPDYDGDNKPDILWRSQVTGGNTYWKMDGAYHAGSDSINAVTDINWEIVGTPDYDTDGKSDILWRNKSTGSNTFWKMNAASFVGADSANAVTDTNWEVVGTPDYDSDTKSDILWRNKLTGNNTYWKMNGPSFVGADGVSAVTDTNWKIRAVR